MCNLEIVLPEGADRCSEDLMTVLEKTMDSLRRYESDGLLVKRNGGFRVTELGQLFVRNLAMPFDRYLDDQKDIKFSRTV